MKIQSVRVKAIPTVTASRTLQEDQYSAHLIKSIDLKDQISTIQRVKASLGIESLAAVSLDNVLSQVRRDVAREMAANPSWYNFLRLRKQLRKERREFGGNDFTTRVMLNSMSKILDQLEPEDMKVDYSEFSFEDYSESIMMKIITNPNFTTGSFDIHLSTPTKISAAEVLFKIIKKIGDSLNDETAILRELLDSPIRAVYEYGLSAAYNTTGHHWRNEIYGTGLVPAFKREGDNELRTKIAGIITDANPKEFLEEHSISGYSENFLPVTRMLTDQCFDVRENIAIGLSRLMLSQEQMGKYFEAFSEIPYIRPEQRFNCLKYGIKLLEEFKNKDSLDYNDSKLFHYACTIIAFSISDKAINSMGDAEWKNNYGNLIQGLNQFDILRFSKVAASIDFQHYSKNGIYYTCWNTCSPIIDKMLHLQAKSQEKPLSYYFDLRGRIEQSISGALTNSRREELLNKIDNAIGQYLTTAPISEINWGDSLEFNLLFKELLSAKNTILDLIDYLHKNGVTISGYENSLEDVLDDSNKKELRKTLSSAIYDGDFICLDILVSPSESETQGKALLLCREITESFKDYYGMQDLKMKALILASKRLERARRCPAGILLSGEIGTGKSFFAKVLANELGLPLVSLIGDKITKTRSGEVLYFDEDNKLTLPLTEYLAKIEYSYPCVLLLDEIEESIDRKNSKKNYYILRFLKGIIRDTIPIIVVATTNRPISSNIKESKIDSNGHSQAYDKVLKRIIHPDSLKMIPPNYLLRKKTAGSSFIYEYIQHLIDIGEVAGDLDLNFVARLGRGLASANVVPLFAGISRKPISAKRVINLVKKLKVESSTLIALRSNMIRMKIEDLISARKCKLVESLDYTLLAILSEDIPESLLMKRLNKVPRDTDQKTLIGLLSPKKQKPSSWGHEHDYR